MHTFWPSHSTYWRRKWQPTPVVLLGESHGQRSLVGYSPRGCKESDTTDWLNNNNKRVWAGFPGGSDSKESASKAGDLVWSLGHGRPMEKEIATHSSILAWRIPWTEEAGGLQSVGLQRVRQDWETNTFTFFQGMCVREKEEERPQRTDRRQHHWTLRRWLGWRHLFFLYFILVSQNAFKNLIFAF